MWKVSMVYLLVALLVVANARPFGVAPAASLSRQKHDNLAIFNCRGGDSPAVADSDEDEDVDLDESDEDVSDDEEEEEIATPKKAGKKLAASAVKAVEKSNAKNTATAKSAVNSGLAESAKKASPSKKKKSRKFKIPYILRACMNPFTVLAMTKAYFASLFNLNYIKKDSSQDLRSALEEKAKKAAGGGSKGKRKMKPGQAKTLSDLPQLNT